MKTDLSFLKEYEKNGFAFVDFPQELRSELITYIEDHIWESGTSLPELKKDSSLKEIAMAIPDHDWSQKFTRAFRIFPKELAHKVYQWADATICNKMGKTRSAVNVVYPAEFEINSKLDQHSLAIYWRCVRPGKPDAGRPHRDASFWELENGEGFDPKIPFPYHYLTDCIKLWIPLKGCTPTTSLQVIPASHKMDIPTLVEQTEYGRRPTISRAWLDQYEPEFISPIQLSQDSVIVFDMNLVHRGPVHENTELRISAELCLVVN